MSMAIFNSKLLVYQRVSSLFESFLSHHFAGSILIQETVFQMKLGWIISQFRLGDVQHPRFETWWAMSKSHQQ